MRTYNIPLTTTARVWFNEKPPAVEQRWTRGRVLQTTVVAATKPISTFDVAPTTVCLEMVTNYGPRLCYGLLSATFAPDSGTGATLVSVAESQGEEILWPDSLVAGRDLVYVGFPEEYTRYLFANIGQSIEARKMPAGNLQFDLACHGSVYSSASYFFRIACHLIDLLSTEQEELTDNKVVTLLSQQHHST